MSKEERILVNIQVGEKNYTGVFYDNPSSQELIKLMPITINMNDLYGNEKYYYLSEKLPANSECIGKINSGDIMLYGFDCLVLFYDTFSTPYSYTKIGYIENISRLEDDLGKVSTEITFDIK